MTTMTYTLSDSATMTRRNLRRLLRYPSMTVLLVGMPIVFLVLFVYVFGGQLGHGLNGSLAAGHVGRAGYLNYVTPGILLLAVAAAVQGTAIVVAMDMTGGIIDRFRTMAIARSAVLTGHVLASLIQTVASLAIVIGVAVALGFRPTGRSRRMAGCDWSAGPVLLCTRLARYCTRFGGQERRNSQQHTDVPHPARIPRQRVRARRHNADGAGAVRPLPTLHISDRDPARAAHRNSDRHERPRRRCLERRDRTHLLLMGNPPLPTPPALVVAVASAN